MPARPRLLDGVFLVREVAGEEAQIKDVPLDQRKSFSSHDLKRLLMGEGKLEGGGMRREGLKGRVTELPSSHRPDRRVRFPAIRNHKTPPMWRTEHNQGGTHLLLQEKMTRKPLKT